MGETKRLYKSMGSITQIAQKLGVNPSTFKDFVDRGIIEHRPRGSYTYEECSKQYLAHLREIAAGRMTVDGLDLSAERARLAKEQADAKEMENAVGRGELVKISDIVADFESQLQKAKVKLLAMPTKIAAETHAASEVKECKDNIHAAIEDALVDLVGYNRQEAAE